jgi:hypothetical protein
MEENSMVISLLTAMITPAVLIMACGQLSLTTSQRLSRSIARTRSLFSELREIKEGKKIVTIEEKVNLHVQLTKSTRRSVLLQKVMSMLYTALLFFIASSLLIGIVEIMNWVRHWVLIAIPLTGAIALFSASILLIMETRLALSSVEEEMKFALTLDTELFRQTPDNHEKSLQKKKVKTEK